MYSQIINFLIMMLVGILFNPMNVLAYQFNHLYLSLTLIYGGILMASNMIWSHEIIHYLLHGKINFKTFLIGIVLSLFTTFFLLRNQFLVDDKEWLKRMISHHSTAITTSEIVLDRSKNPKVKKVANEIIQTQLKEIALMKQYLKEY